MNLFDEEKTRKGKKGKDISSSGGSRKNEKKPPELVFKVASDIKGNSPEHSIDYITHSNEKKHGEKGYIEPENEAGKKLSKNELENLKKEWKQEFSKDNKINTRNLTHFVFSINIEKKGNYKKKFNDAATELLQKRFGNDGFRYIFTQHEDTKHPHIHVLVNNNNLETCKKLRMNNNWHRETRLLAKEALHNNGIIQSATFKRDMKKTVRELSNPIKTDKKSYETCSNWIEAKLKANSFNDNHFKNLVKQYQITSELIKQINKASAGKENNSRDKKIHTQEQVALTKAIRDLQKKMTLYKGFTSRLEVNTTLSKLIKDSKVKPQVIKSSIDKAENKTATQEKRKLYSHAKDLINAKVILDSSADLSPGEKKKINLKIDRRLNEMEKKGVDIYSIKEKSKLENSIDPKANQTYRAINNLIKIVDKNTLEKKNMIPGELEKKYIRVLNNVHSYNKNPLDKGEKTIIDERLEELSSKLKMTIDVKEIKKDWEKARSLKDKIQVINIDFEKGLEPKNKIQQRIFDLQKEVDNPPKQLNQKEVFSMNENLKKLQLKYDAKHLTLYYYVKSNLERIKLKVEKNLEFSPKSKTTEQSSKSEQKKITDTRLPKVTSELINKYKNVNRNDLYAMIKDEEKTLENARKTPSFKAVINEMELGLKEKVAINDHRESLTLRSLNKSAKEMSKLLDSKPSLSTEQKTELNKKVSEITDLLKSKNIDLRVSLNKRELTVNLIESLKKRENMNMKNTRTIGFDTAISDIEKMKKRIPLTDISRDSKRNLTKRVNDIDLQTKSAIETDHKIIVKGISDIKELDKKLNYYKKNRNLSPTEKLSNVRNIEKVTKEISEIAKKLQPLISAAPKANISSDMSNTFKKALSISKDVGMKFNR